MRFWTGTIPSNSRHSRAGGNLTTAIRLKFKLDSRLRGNDDLMGCGSLGWQGGRAVLKSIAKPAFPLYTAPIPDSTMSNNTGPEYGSEGEESYVRTSDAQGHCRLVG